MCICRPFKHFFHRQFCFTITICRKCTIRFHNRNSLRFSISCRCRRKHNLIYTMRNHALQQYFCTTKIITIIFQWLYHTFAYLRTSCKMNNSIYIFFIKYRVNKSSVTNISFIKLRFRMNRCPKTCFKIIYNHHILSCINQLINSMRANISGSA